MNSTIVLSHSRAARHVDSVLWLHIIISLLIYGLCLPLIYILKQRQHVLLTSLEIISATAIGVGILFGIIATAKYRSKSHSLLGYLILTISEVYLVLDLWLQRCGAKSASTRASKTQLLLFRWTWWIERLVPFMVYIEIVLGSVAV
jgi:hypothetical protein